LGLAVESNKRTGNKVGAVQKRRETAELLANGTIKNCVRVFMGGTGVITKARGGGIPKQGNIHLAFAEAVPERKLRRRKKNQKV